MNDAIYRLTDEERTVIIATVCIAERRAQEIACWRAALRTTGTDDDILARMGAEIASSRYVADALERWGRAQAS